MPASAPTPVHPSPATSSAAAIAPAVQARSVVRVGKFTGVALVLEAAVQGALAEQARGGQGLLWTAVVSAVGLALALLAPPLADRGILTGGLRAEVRRGNEAAAIVSGAHYVGVGVVLSHCLYGVDATSFAVSLAFFTIGFATLLALQWLYRKLTRYAEDQEVRGANAAAALSFSGVTVALSIIIGHAAGGIFTGWASSLQGYAIALALALCLYPVRQLIVKRLLLGLPFAYRGGGLDDEIAQRRNVTVGAVEGLAYIATAVLATGLL